MSAAGTRPARTDAFVCVTHSHAGTLAVVLRGLTAAGRRLKGQNTKGGGGCGGGRESTLRSEHETDEAEERQAERGRRAEFHLRCRLHKLEEICTTRASGRSVDHHLFSRPDESWTR